MKFDGNRPFTKGVSGNPGGRPKGLERMVRELVAEQRDKDKNGVDLDGWQRLTMRLFGIAMGDNEREAIAAVKLLYERGYGYPKQNVRIEDPAAASIDWSRVPIEKRRAFVELYEKLGLVDDGAPRDGEPTEH